VQTLLDTLPISLPVFLVLFASVVVGALVQGTIGFGLNVIAAPVAAIVQPEALPAAMIIMSLPMTAGSAVREHAHIDREGVVFTTLGRLPGVMLGGFIVSWLEPEVLAAWIGGMVVVAALMSLSAANIPITALSTALVGTVAGVMGTTSSIGGPPLALLYQRESGPVLRSTLGAAFLIGSSLSLTALALAGHVHVWHWALGVALTPAVAIGLLLSRGLRARVDAGLLRPCVVGLASLAGLTVMLRGLT
jgi:uncharacterized membrane protein YfcA